MGGRAVVTPGREQRIVGETVEFVEAGCTREAGALSIGGVIVTLGAEAAGGAGVSTSSRYTRAYDEIRSRASADTRRGPPARTISSIEGFGADTLDAIRRG